MDITIPYHAGFLLGRSVQMRSLKEGFFPQNVCINPENLETNLDTSAFAFVRSLKDVCSVLEIPPEYALKVKARVIENDVVSACMKTLENKDAFSVIFRQKFLHKKLYLPREAMQNAVNTKLQEPVKCEMSLSESLLADAVAEGLSLQSVSETSLSSGEDVNGQGDAIASLQSQGGDTKDTVTVEDVKPDISSITVAREKDTHFVKGHEIGNEQIVVLRFYTSSNDHENMDSLRQKLAKELGASQGQLSHDKIRCLLELGEKLDKKLSKKTYQDVRSEIDYCVFEDLGEYPATIHEMAKVLDSFMDKCIGWKEKSKEGAHNNMNVDARFMAVHVGSKKQEQKSIGQAIKDRFSGLVSIKTSDTTQDAQITYTASSSSDVDGEDYDSFVVFDSSQFTQFFALRVTLQSYEDDAILDGEQSLTSLAMSQSPESTYSLFQNLLKMVCHCEEATEKLSRFLSGSRFLLENRVDEANQVLKDVQSVHLSVFDAIKCLDFINMPDEAGLKEICSANPLIIVETYIENVTSKLPPGLDLDLLMIGKTGHGKSATGNSILGLTKFYSCADGESVTKNTSMGWADVDGRILKVVDTPGVCDTQITTDEGSIDLAIRSISDAIAHCPQGFNALLLIIRYGARMTDEEKRAIGLLKCVLGQDVFKSHCVCVITHGDNFQAEYKGTQTFEQWCKSQKGFLQSIFEECSYRCVLFNNKSENPKEKKAQLIQLINKVDSFKDLGTRYTNSIFEFAQRERERIVAEQEAPQVNEETIRDIQLILDYLNNMVTNTGEADVYNEELSALTQRVDNLSSRVSEGGNNEQLSTLVDTVFALAAAVHAKMDEIADAPSLAPESEQPSAGVQSVQETQDTDRDVSGSPTEPRSLEDCRQNLQDYYDKQVSPKTDSVNEKVADALNAQIHSENKCFPGESLVIFPDGRRIPLSKVKVGDKVLVRSSDGALKYDDIYMFGHREPLVNAEFLQVNTDSTSVCVSSDHSVYCVQNGEEKCVTASELTEDDELFVVNSSVSVLTTAPVRGIKYVKKQGMFAPFTLSGSVVVDDTLMSCYVNKPPPHVAHVLLWPMRQIYKVSPRLLDTINGTDKRHAIPWWAQAYLKFL